MKRYTIRQSITFLKLYKPGKTFIGIWEIDTERKPSEQTKDTSRNDRNPVEFSIRQNGISSDHREEDACYNAEYGHQLI